MVRPKLARARAPTKTQGKGKSSSTESEAMLKQPRITSSAVRRPCQLSSVSARALAMMPRNSGISSSMRSCCQHSAMLPVRATKTRRL
ncbi:hypothetical protein D9M71_559050 [compost metagenome]